MFPTIKTYCENLSSRFAEIPEKRKQNLKLISDYITSKKNKKEEIALLYVCTHNSRRSHFGQVWAKVASDYFQVPQVNSFSGGTESTAFNLNAINALKRVGFKINSDNKGTNPVYEVGYDKTSLPVKCFSKTYDHPSNPTKGFAAIMTCSEAEQNCPFISGCELRVATSYEDPKEFDNSNQMELKYDERCRQIALETLYIFSLI